MIGEGMIRDVREASVNDRKVGLGAVQPEQLSTTAASVPETRYDLRVLQALRRVIQSIDLYSRRLVSRHRITAPQLVCLLAIRERGAVSVKGVAAEVHLSPSTVVGILDRLEAKGLIERHRSQKDRRLVQVTLTEQGRQMGEAAPSPLQDTLADAMDGLPESEQAQIAESLERIVELMQVRHVDAAPILQAGPIQPTTKEEFTAGAPMKLQHSPEEEDHGLREGE